MPPDIKLEIEQLQLYASYMLCERYYNYMLVMLVVLYDSGILCHV
jgi:hypothetical protein